jgi:ABC-type multidrug transport system fused ATPase/permease subunit
MNLMLLIKHYKRLIVFALMLVVIEDVAWIVEPYIFGKVIDAVIDVQIFEKKNTIVQSPNKSEQEKIKELEDEGLLPDSVSTDTTPHNSIWDSIKVSLKDNPEGSIFLPLALWILAFLINSGVGAFRRSIDPKIFLRIYTRIATSISRNSILRKISISKTTARVELSQQFIGFLEFRVPEIIQNAISIGGAVIALYFFDWIISLTCLLIVLPMYIINKLYMRKVGALQKEFHDNYEEIYDVFAKKDPVHVRDYYNNLAKPQKRIANWGAFNFAFMRFTLLIIFLVVLYVAIELDNFSAGELYSIVAYLWTFVSATEYMPELLENWSSMKDIARRLKEEN